MRCAKNRAIGFWLLSHGRRAAKSGTGDASVLSAWSFWPRAGWRIAPAASTWKARRGQRLGAETRRDWPAGAIAELGSVAGQYGYLARRGFRCGLAGRRRTAQVASTAQTEEGGGAPPSLPNGIVAVLCAYRRPPFTIRPGAETDPGAASQPSGKDASVGGGRTALIWRGLQGPDRRWTAKHESTEASGAVQKAVVEERAGSPGGCGRGRHGVAGHGGWRWTAVVGTGRTETRGAVRQERSGRVRMTMTPPGTSEQPRPTSTPGAGKTKVGIHGIAMDMDMDMDMASTAHGGTARAGSEQ
ncbi:hypothetical protein Purlil1_6595 [Purpureocillium lilacinum]|uniref:Uncharacterized protein n=1 Tax=Purpureocillium lilacinum TaxID=33203 RepID=A0ABR0BYK4_PURLI|nr:hypothetical protein Purlil1_6595 [Purpureocillium lilacinum]